MTNTIIHILHIHNQEESFNPIISKGIDHRSLPLENGEKALNYLNALSQSDLPTILLIDMHLSLMGMSSMELLHKIRNNGNFKHIPVLLIASSKVNMIDPQTWRPLKDFVFKPICIEVIAKVLSMAGITTSTATETENYTIL
jgi:CheY-like chemotaxis protein